MIHENPKDSCNSFKVVPNLYISYAAICVCPGLCQCLCVCVCVCICTINQEGVVVNVSEERKRLMVEWNSA
ncbi:hypothetical protein L2E82_40683 [Cichorium intybus]|uniref:Uncharacterized protein n=1 Tax=Cichorium intybus TaxID=13427 RepID=A0ACB9AMF2_CICIN|nr:hypothetical protein L2E82_40683 [Cichorium intybus]